LHVFLLCVAEFDFNAANIWPMKMFLNFTPLAGLIRLLIFGV